MPAPVNTNSQSDSEMMMDRILRTIQGANPLLLNRIQKAPVPFRRDDPYIIEIGTTEFTPDMHTNGEHNAKHRAT
jgi:hypothetical protein